jgi:hypothetical protein
MVSYTFPFPMEGMLVSPSASKIKLNPTIKGGTIIVPLAHLTRRQRAAALVAVKRLRIKNSATLTPEHSLECTVTRTRGCRKGDEQRSATSAKASVTAAIRKAVTPLLQS